jgi:hypothetical protein
MEFKIQEGVGLRLIPANHPAAFMRMSPSSFFEPKTQLLLKR